MAKIPSQKTMLSKALEKANTAVQLDNAQNFEGAVEAYSDACWLLQQVMNGSTGDDDKQKLETIVRSGFLPCRGSSDVNLADNLRNKDR
jgi:MIT (microtubule interacting and transport) domain